MAGASGVMTCLVFAFKCNDNVTLNLVIPMNP